MYYHPVQTPEAVAASSPAEPIADQAQACSVTSSKRIHDDSSGFPFLWVSVQHEASRLHGTVWIDMTGVPEAVAADIDGMDWTHPLLQEMQHEAMQEFESAKAGELGLRPLFKEI